MGKIKVAFICVGNSARNQMAEALVKFHAKLFGLEEKLEFYSVCSKC